MSKVQLIKPHTHAGHVYKPDDVIDVTPPEAVWLKNLGIVQDHNRDTSADVTHSTLRGKSRDTDRDTREENDQ